MFIIMHDEWDGSLTGRRTGGRANKEPTEKCAEGVSPGPPIPHRKKGARKTEGVAPSNPLVKNKRK